MPLSTGAGIDRYTPILAAWQFTPPITLGLLLLACLYATGMRRRSHAAKSKARWGRWDWRPPCFFAGVASLYLALQSPLDFLSDHLFCVHQVQHLVLMMIAPALLLAPAPAATLIAGLPRCLRPLVLAPLARSRPTRATFAFLTHPITATILCAGTLYFWMVPAVYDTALVHERIHDMMHFSLLLTGLLFWWRVLDARRPPFGAPYLYRAAMLKANLMMVALLGAFLAEKPYSLYRGSADFGGLHLPRSRTSASAEPTYGSREARSSWRRSRSRYGAGSSRLSRKPRRRRGASRLPERAPAPRGKLVHGNRFRAGGRACSAAGASAETPCESHGFPYPTSST